MAEEQLGFDMPEGGSHKPETSGKAGKKAADEAPAGPRKLADDEVFDYITGDKVVKLTEAEKVRQHIARSLVQQYGIDPHDMEADFSIPVINADGRKSRRRASIAIFEHGEDHELQYLRRVVVTKPRPKDSRTVSKIRTYAHAKAQIDEVGQLMLAAPDCKYGMWTDNKDLYFICKDDDSSLFETQYRPLLNWPRGDATSFDAHGDASSLAIMRRADERMLRFAFRRCHNYIHGNEGLPKDAAFWQFLYVLFAKLHDERLVREGANPRFRIDSHDLAAAAEEEAGSAEVAQRIRELFEEVKDFYSDQQLFDDYDRLTLTDGALTFITKQLATYRMHDTSLDALGTAYQELVGDNLRGDRGQYFTPSGAVRLMVEMLNPQEGQTVLDPCCGTGGFLRETLLHVLHTWMPDDEQDLSVQERARQETAKRKRLSEYAQACVFGTDFDPFLTRAAAFGVMMLTDIAGNTFQVDSLGFPRMGTLRGMQRALRHLDRIAPGEVDILLTNPPFGSDIPVTGPVLELFRTDESGFEKERSIAYSWSRDEDSTLVKGKPAVSIAPEKLFVQKAVEWVKPGGRIGIVLPNGILSTDDPSPPPPPPHPRPPPGTEGRFAIGTSSAGSLLPLMA
ncbi:N-6 DNA methylase, partial [Streptomyces sp. NBC_00199]|uniref:restriction endonuclease subunit M n=1 Tax=Streptomyces sp. NBC_00199 TaxID=2975678 RepID=UPI00225777A0